MNLFNGCYSVVKLIGKIPLVPEKYHRSTDRSNKSAATTGCSIFSMPVRIIVVYYLKQTCRFDNQAPLRVTLPAHFRIRNGNIGPAGAVHVLCLLSVNFLTNTVLSGILL
jgi:hypothetical protein